jgi:hypothetical protein
MTVGTPSTPENGRGQYNFRELCCSCVQHKEDLCPVQVVHFEYMYSHNVDNLCLSISFGMEGSRIGQFSVYRGAKVGPKYIKDLVAPFIDNVSWKPQMNPNVLKEEIGSGF